MLSSCTNILFQEKIFGLGYNGYPLFGSGYHYPVDFNYPSYHPSYYPNYYPSYPSYPSYYPNHYGNYYGGYYGYGGYGF